MTSSDEVVPGRGGAFLLTALGTLSAQHFAERISALELTPPQAGLLRAVADGPGRSQQALAGHLGTPAPRLVALVDGLEQRGLLERRRNAEDRRVHAVHLSEAGERLLAELARASVEHDEAVLAPLRPAQRDQLAALLTSLADGHGLTHGVHPGYRTMGPPDTACP